ncbi:MAG: vitamin B12-dependent ribonucleotide reductase [bacterium]|nr:vitamin B12-dependent ribonucleotide reductase [bacterium]
MQTATQIKLNRKAKNKKKDDAWELLSKIKITPYDQILEQIKKKVGPRPLRPNDLPSGFWGEQSLRVLEERYLLKDDKGNFVETPEDMIWRVAWEVASSESRYGKSKKEVLESARDFYLLMTERKFLPNSPTLMNAGTGNFLQYSGCFVVPVEDSMEGIFDALKYQALIHKTGGGTGFSFSRLRPRGALVRASSGTASGPVSFMKIFDAATNEVKQGGKRRGANMGILRADHPDILEFIHCKEKGGITNFNISVGVTDRFMEALEKDEEYDLYDPKTGEAVGKLSARAVFNEICDLAWKTGDPGMVFIDRINQGRANPVPSLGPIESTNPCGEQPLYPFDACNLGSIFLTYFVKEDEEGKPEVDWEGLKKTTRQAVRFLDDVIDINPFTLDQIKRMALAIRRIGLGVGGWADMLVKLGIPYDSQEAVDLAEKVMRTVQEESGIEDCALAKERGSFPLFSHSIYADDQPRRNSTITTIAPTGTISIIAGVSSGIEPLFAVSYMHIVKDEHLDRRMTFFNTDFETALQKRGLLTEELMKEISEKGVVRDLETLPSDLRAIFGTAHEIAPEWHIKMQSAFQKYTDNAVSKTINLVHDAQVEEVKKAYLQAWETNCKGITVFRDGCKSAQVLNLGNKEDPSPPVGESGQEKEKEPPVNGAETLKPRPVKVDGATYKIATPLGNAFITVNHDSYGNPFEVFITIGKAGSEVAAMAESLGRMISMTLRFGNHLPAIERAKRIIVQLQGIGGGHSVGFGPNKVKSIPDAVAKALGMHFGLMNYGGETEETESLSNGILENNSAQISLFTHHKDFCPGCGEGSLIFQEGCKKCYVCGYSEC